MIIYYISTQWRDISEYNQWQSFKICAGDYEYELASRKMTCRYNHRNSPFLTIAPLKEEIISLAPQISVFREVVYDSEIEQLKRDSYNKVNFVLFCFVFEYFLPRTNFQKRFVPVEAGCTPH